MSEPLRCERAMEQHPSEDAQRAIECTVTEFYVIAVIPKSSFRGDAERRTRNPEVVAEIPGSRWRAPRNDVPGSERRSADEQTITVRESHGATSQRGRAEGN